MLANHFGVAAQTTRRQPGARLRNLSSDFPKTFDYFPIVTWLLLMRGSCEAVAERQTRRMSS